MALLKFLYKMVSWYLVSWYLVTWYPFLLQLYQRENDNGLATESPITKNNTSDKTICEPDEDDRKVGISNMKPTKKKKKTLNKRPKHQIFYQLLLIANLKNNNK